MADTKITALAAITTVDPAADVLPIVDISDTSMAASGTTKKITSNQILGAGGTATLASATITGDLTVDTSTLFVNSASDTVGIRTATPGDVLEVVGSGANGLRISRSGLPGQYTTFSAGATGQTIDAAAVIGVITFGIGGSEAMRLSATGLNVANGNVILGTSGKGIDFSATPSGSGTMTSELLNDYEEGTWVGTLKGSVSDPTTPVTATGRYTKVGRQVSVQIEFNNVSTAGASGNVFVIGLPFSNSSIAGCAGSVITFLTATFTETLGCIIGGVSTAIDIYSVKSNSSWVAATHNAGTGRYLWLNITYTV
jgi:hypothetical protein